MHILFRRLKKQPVIYGIKIGGLALGIAVSTLIFTYVNFESSYDAFHGQSEDIYRIVYHLQSANSNKGFARTAPAYVPTFKDEFSGVVDGFRIKRSGGFAEYENEKFKEDNIYYADNGIFEVLTIPLSEGNPKTALLRPNTVVINQETKEKYFGSNPALGKTILLEGEIPLEVTGIFNNYPRQSHLNPRILVSWGTYESIRGKNLNEIWRENIFYSYVRLQDQEAYLSINQKLDEFVQKHLKKEEDTGEQITLELQPISSIHLSSHLLYEISPNSSQNTIYFLMTIAILILIVSIINFVNINTVVVNDRFEEASVRKTFGATPNNLIMQHLYETGGISYLSAILAVLVIAIVQPFYSQLISIEFGLGAIFSGSIMYLYLLLPLLITILAGLYPAFKFASFKPALRSGKSQTSNGDNLVKNGLVVFQFCISLILVITTIVVYKQMDYVQKYDYGFNEEGIIVLPYVGEKYELFKSELVEFSPVRSVSASGDIPGNMYTTLSYEAEGAGPEKSGTITTLLADHSFLDTYEVDLIAGRNYRPGTADLHHSIILNKEAVNQLGWTPEEAIGKSYKLDPFGNKGRVVGVTDNFHVYSLHKKIEPLAMAVWPEWFWNISVKIQKSEVGKALDDIELIWDEIGIAQPFDYSFLDESFENQYRSDQVFGKIFSVFAVLAIFIACIGLFGLILHKTRSMEKEISIRKVLGATTQNITFLLAKHTYVLVGIAILFSIPLAYVTIQQWIKDFSYHADIGIMPFLAGSLTVLVITTLTILYHTLQASLQNPIVGLRKEQ